jgi:hypothetical protein
VKRLFALWPYALLALGALSAAWPFIGLPAAFLSFLGVLSVPARTEPAARGPRRAVALAVVCASVGLVRFVVEVGVPGIVEGGRVAVEQRAVSRLREVLFAEDAMRRSGWIDPDRDGVGSAAFLGELCGGPPLRGQAARSAPVLACGELEDTALGPAGREAGYLYTVCLPAPDGSWSADPTRPVDEEAAERRFVAYAWPAPGSSFEHAFFLDQDELILSAPRRAFGLVCSSALDPATRAAWSPWRGKRPRSGPLPGDH